MSLADDLPARLVHQAAEASRAAYERQFGIPADSPATSLHEWTDEARAAVAAALPLVAAWIRTDGGSLAAEGIADRIELLAARLGVAGERGDET